jgi:hypothetical protein
MSADLHIHIISGRCTEEHVKVFESNSMGGLYEGYNHPELSKLSRFGENGYEDGSEKIPFSESICGIVEETPNIWIGEVSWLKAAFFGENEKYIPDPVQKISDAVGETFPVIDDFFIERIRQIFKTVKNTTRYKVAKSQDVMKFLNEHRGKKVFCISW